LEILNLTEKQRIESIRQGDARILQVIFNEYYPVLTVFALKFLNDTDLAKEVVQEMFVRLYEKRKTINIQTSLKSYLYQSVRNACLNRIRQDKTHQRHHEEILKSAEKDSGWDDHMVEAELEQRIYHVISNLPPKCKEIFLLSRQEDLTNREISEKLNISIRTIENQITKALKTLRESIDL
jgi:RNA polymerase sigma-70 factor (ECF subfamily)